MTCEIEKIEKSNLAYALKYVPLTDCSQTNFVVPPQPIVFVWGKYIVDGCRRLKYYARKYATALERSAFTVYVAELRCKNVGEALLTRVAMNYRYELCEEVYHVPKQLRQLFDQVCISIFEKRGIKAENVQKDEKDKEEGEKGEDGLCKKVKFERYEKVDELDVSEYCHGYRKVTIPLLLYREVEKKYGNVTRKVLEFLKSLL